MKKILLVLTAIMSVAQIVTSQDLIVLQNAEDIEAKIKTVGINELTYLKWDNLDGPIYTILKSDIFYIKYQNGYKEIFNKSANADSITYQKKGFSTGDFSNVIFQGYAYLGADFSSGFGGPALDFSVGVRSSKYFYIGGGIAWHNLIGEYYDVLSGYYYSSLWLPYITFTSDIKAFIPTKSGFTPRFDLSVGGVVFPIFPYDPYCGLYMSVGAGFDYNRFSFGAGYQMPCLSNLVEPMGYVRLGVRLGK